MWLDEPFRDKTLKGALVLVNQNHKYVIGEIKEIIDDDENTYKLGKNKLTGVYFKLIIQDDKPENIIKFKVFQISNHKIIKQEFDNFTYNR